MMQQRYFLHLLPMILALLGLPNLSFGQYYYNCDGGMVKTTKGKTEVTITAGDGLDDVINFVYKSKAKTKFTFLITDEKGKILGIPFGARQNFEGAGPGVCLVWNLSYTGKLKAKVGHNALKTKLATGCFDLSDNYIKVIRNGASPVEGGTVSMPSGATERYTCPGDGTVDFIKFASHGASGPFFTYIITDPNGKILGIPTGNFQNFEGAGIGTCLVWGLAYSGKLTAKPGDNAAKAKLSTDEFDLSDNFITIYRDVPDGGTVSTIDGETEVSTTAGDGKDDVIEFASAGTSNSKFTYIITDEEGKILGVPRKNSQNFEGAGPGVCLVWGLSYTGDLRASLGANALESNLSTECFDLSDNFIKVNRFDPVEGGTVAMPSGATERYTCPGDGMDDVVMFVSEGANGPNFTYVITDPDGNILGIPPGNSQNFEGAGPGICLVWGLSYSGNITVEAGDNALEMDLSDGAFDLSDNFITINRDTPDGGMVATSDGATEVTIIAGDGTDDVIEFVSEGVSNSQFTYVITDENGIILGIPPGNSQNFEGAGAGVCLVWGLAYTGMITAQPGDNAKEVALSDGCFDLSDKFLTVNRQAPEARIAGVNTQTNTPLQVFPNPVRETLNLRFQSSEQIAGNARLSILDGLGRIVQDGLYPSEFGDNQIELDIHNLGRGIYTLRLMEGGKVSSKKIVKIE